MQALTLAYDVATGTSLLLVGLMLLAVLRLLTQSWTGNVEAGPTTLYALLALARQLRLMVVGFVALLLVLARSGAEVDGMSCLAACAQLCLSLARWTAPSAVLAQVALMVQRMRGTRGNSLGLLGRDCFALAAHTTVVAFAASILLGGL